jgi:hypothetical protein
MALDDLINRAGDPSLLDVDRIAAMEAMLLEADDLLDGRRRIFALLSDVVLRDDDDYLVRLIAAREVSLYPCGEPVVAERLYRLLADPDEDIDIRVNLLDAFETWKYPALSQLRESLSESDPLKEYVGREV